MASRVFCDEAGWSSDLGRVILTVKGTRCFLWLRIGGAGCYKRCKLFTMNGTAYRSVARNPLILMMEGVSTQRTTYWRLGNFSVGYFKIHKMRSLMIMPIRKIAKRGNSYAIFQCPTHRTNTSCTVSVVHININENNLEIQLSTKGNYNASNSFQRGSLKNKLSGTILYLVHRRTIRNMQTVTFTMPL